MYEELTVLYGAIFEWSMENTPIKYGGRKWTLQVQCDPIQEGIFLSIVIRLFNEELQSKVVERKVCSTTAEAVKLLDEFYEDLPFVFVHLM